MISKKSKAIQKQNGAVPQKGKAKANEEEEVKSQSKNESYHIHLVKINDKEIPKPLFSLNEKNLFEALIYPLSPQEFFEKDYA